MEKNVYNVYIIERQPLNSTQEDYPNTSVWDLTMGAKIISSVTNS